MARISFSTAFNNTNNAGFQAWATEIYDNIIAAGLVQTTDTGQLSTPVSASRPANGAYAGYWIFRFNDSLQGTAPIFIKIEPGRGNSGDTLAIRVNIGTGSNGSGTITGAVLTAQRIDNNSFSASSVTPYPSYVNHDEGFFAFGFKSGGTTGGAGMARLIIARTCDDDTTPNASGYWIERITSTAAASVICGTWGGSSLTDNARNWSVVTMGVTNSAVGSDYQVFKCYGAYRAARIVPQVVVCLASELPVGNQTGDVEIVNGVDRNFLSLGPAGAPCCATSTLLTYNYAIQWDA